MQPFVDVPPPYPPVEEVLPHAPPMVLLDEIEQVGATTARARLTLRSDSMFVSGGKVPAAVALEYIAQTIGVMLGTQARYVGARVTGGFVVGVPNLDLHAEHFAVGDTLVVAVEHVWGEAELWKFRGQVLRNGTCLAEGDVSILRLPPDPADLPPGASNETP
ncbi:MAG: hypothetical protein D6705_15920 [Deltaproteobacteria bacterium]|nr:MAG: hypothetical protein D6705_15920 [Deltaproteobacteria bacterium]